MSTHKVFYFSHAPQNVYEIIHEEVPPGFELISLNEDSDDERQEKLADCEVVIVAARPMTREFVEAAPALKLLHHQGVGYQDTVDVAALKAHKVTLALTPGFCRHDYWCGRTHPAAVPGCLQASALCRQ